MYIKLKSYMSAENGLSLQIYPETNVEEELLRGFFKHGNMETGHQCKAEGKTGFYLKWKQEPTPPT